MRRLDQDVPEVSVAAACDVSTASSLSARVLTWSQSRIAHELAGGGEASEVTGLGNDGGGGMESQAAQTLDGRYKGQEGALFCALLEPGVQAAPAVFSCSKGADVVFECQLLGERFEIESVEPAVVTRGVWPEVARGRDAVAEQEFGQAMSRPQQVDLGILTGANQIAQGLVLEVRNPDRGQVSTT